MKTEQTPDTMKMTQNLSDGKHVAAAKACLRNECANGSAHGPTLYFTGVDCNIGWP